MLKQVIIVRSDLEMGKGKLAAQVAHASVQGFYNMLIKNREKALQWLESGAKKVVLKVQSEEELFRIYQHALSIGLNAVIIKDSGLTQLEPGTTTTVSIGPDDEESINRITGHLKLL